MENNNPETKKEVPEREMMTMPDNSVADVTGMSPEEKKELLQSYKPNN